MKLKKRIFAIFTVMILAISLFTMTASAANTITRTASQGSTSNKFNISYAFDVNSSLTSTNKGFWVSSYGSYTITFPGTSGTSAKVYVYKEGSTTAVKTINIPVAVPGMGTLSTTANLTEGNYYIKVKSTSTSTRTIGSITFKDVASIATIG